MLRLLAVAVVVASVVGLRFYLLINSRTVVVGDGLHVTQDGDSAVLSADGIGEVARTSAAISHAQMNSYPDSSVKTIVWTAGGENFYAISLDGTTIARSTPADYKLMLRYAEFDPLVSIPRVPFTLKASEARGGERAYIVQFVTHRLMAISAR